MTQIDFYKTDDSQNTINKTLTKIGTKNVNLLFNYDYMEFQAYLKGDQIILSSNYAIIGNNHYFINLESIGGTIYLVTFTLDLLETYKDTTANLPHAGCVKAGIRGVYAALTGASYEEVMFASEEEVMGVIDSNTRSIPTAWGKLAVVS